MSDEGTDQPGWVVALCLLVTAVGAATFLGFLALDPFAPFYNDSATVTARFETESTCRRSGGSGPIRRVPCPRYTVAGVTDSGEQWSVVRTTPDAYDIVTMNQDVTIGRSRMSGKVTLIDADTGTYRSWSPWSLVTIGGLCIGFLWLSVAMAHNAVTTLLAGHSRRTARLITAATMVVTVVVILTLVLTVFADPVADRPVERAAASLSPSV